ncbi:MAG TPA: DNA-directed RNA polymerase subunit K [Candidatus Thermoplasmatota archaeon]
MKLSRFEKARIIGARALQISMGAPIMVDIPGDLYEPIKIAELEYGEDAIPITVRRAQEIDFKWD